MLLFTYIYTANNTIHQLVLCVIIVVEQTKLEMLFRVNCSIITVMCNILTPSALLHLYTFTVLSLTGDHFNIRE